MKGYVSLDILRSAAIFLMIVFHIPMVWYERGSLESGSVSEFHPLVLLLLFSIIFFGAFAGFFLMVSAISNMVSVERSLERGKSPWKMVAFQVVSVSILSFPGIKPYHGSALL